MSHFSIGLWCEMESRLYTKTSNGQLRSWTEKRLQSTFQSQTCTKKSVMVTVQWFADSLIHYSFQNPGETIIFEKYAQQMNEMHWKLQCLQPALVNRKGSILLNNPQLHIAQPTLQKLSKLGYKVLLHLLVCASQVAPVVKSPPVNGGDARDVNLIPESGRSPAVGNSNLLQYSCLENSMARRTRGLQSIRSQRVGHDWAHMYMPEVLSTMKSEISHDISFSVPIVLNYDPHLLTFLYLWTLRLSITTRRHLWDYFLILSVELSASLMCFHRVSFLYFNVLKSSIYFPIFLIRCGPHEDRWVLFYFHLWYPQHLV